MKKSILLVFIQILVISVLVIGCSPATPTPTPTLQPTSTPFVMPQGDFEMTWDTYNSQYNSLGGTLTIRRQGSKYTQTLVMSDGSTGTTELTVLSGAGIRLTDRPGNPYDDYIYISSNGYLYFCDYDGVIYSVPLVKMTTSS